MTVKELQSEYNTARAALDVSLKVSIKSKVLSYMDEHDGVSKTQANRIVRTEHKELNVAALDILHKLAKSDVAIANVKSYKNSDSVSFRSRKVIEHQIAGANKRSKATVKPVAKPRKPRKTAKK